MTDNMNMAWCKAAIVRWWVVAAPVLVLAGICAWHLIGVVREDYAAYLYMFHWAQVTGWSGVLTFPYRDYGFGALLLVLATIVPSSDVLWFFLIALLGLGVKFYCFFRFAPVYWVAALVHIAFFFVLQDYTQLRVSLGVALLMLGAGLLVSRTNDWKVVGYWGIAAGFHVQTIVAMAFALAGTFSLTVFLAGSGLSLFAGNALTAASSHFDRLVAYANPPPGQQMPNPFSTVKLFEYLTFGLFLFYRREIDARGWRLVNLSGWFVLAGLAVFFGLLRFPAAAHRFSEMFFAFLPFLVAGLYSLMPRRWAVPYLVVGIAIGLWASYRILYVWQ